MELSKSAALSLSKGYKQSEIGNIPDEWDVKQLKDITTFRRGSFPQPYGLTKWYDDFNGAPFVQVFDVDNNGQIKNETKRKISKEAQFYSVFAPKGTLILTIQGSIGRMAITQYDAYIDRTLLIFEGYKIPLDIVYFATSIQVLFEREEKIAPGGIIKTITKEALSTFCIPLPPTKAEQTAIANALSDADALISSLEKLINKKRNIKQGAMQQLLKPKKGWITKKLGTIGKLYGGLSGKSKTDFFEGKYPYIPFMNIMSNPIIDSEYLDYVNIGSGENQNQTQKGDLFFNGSSETPEEVGMCSVLLKDIPNLYLNSFCFGYRLFNQQENDGMYLSYYFRSTEGRKLFYSSAQGATRYNLSKANFLKLEILIPDYDEQVRIASFIMDMDYEISTLEKKLSKSKMLKQGMIQELLTGKIRLI